MSSSSKVFFDRERHIKYFAHHLIQLPFPYSSLDTNRLTLVHFACHALDMLQVWDDSDLVQKLNLKPTAIINWIYNLLVTETENNDNNVKGTVGFKGGTFLGGSFGACCCDHHQAPPADYNHGHIAMTYTALATLKLLGDDFRRLQPHKTAILASLKQLQRPDGSFQCLAVGSEQDTRFLFCACAISHMLNDWSAVNIPKACEFVRKCRSFDGAIALIPGQEGHGGSTFCGVAALVLMKQLDQVIDTEWRKELIQWCTHRQLGGMQGRPNKVEDTCYSFWIGGTLKLLGNEVFALLDHHKLQSFVLSCQSPLGGFSKHRGAFPDMLHSFYSLSYLNLSTNSKFDDNDDDDEENDLNIKLKPMNCTLGICQSVADQFIGGSNFP